MSRLINRCFCTYAVLQFFLLRASATAETVGYWRFEAAPGFCSDSAQYGLDLLASGDVPATYVLPPQGAGSAFPSPVPQVQLANRQAAGFSSNRWFEVPDHPAFNLGSAFTIEVFFNSSKSVNLPINLTSYLVSQSAPSNNQAGWFLGTRGNQLRFGLSGSGTGITRVESQFAGSGIAPNSDYYAAAVFNAGNVTFYLQNLSAGGALEASVIGALPIRLFDTNARFKIGSSDANPVEGVWQGLIDEVRLSSGALAVSDLLAPSPAPQGTVVDGLYLSADGYQSPPILVPLGKRVPFGWPSFSVAPAGDSIATFLSWPAQSLPLGDQMRLRLAVALDTRESNHVSMRLRSSQELLGTFDFTRSTVFQLGEIAITRDQAVQVIDQGVELRRLEGSLPLRFFAPTPSARGIPGLLQPHLLAAGTTDRWVEFRQRMRTRDLVQNFGWMEGCVIEGITALAEAFPTGGFSGVVDSHLSLFLDEANLFCEDTSSWVSDNVIYGCQATLPFASIARRRPEHPVVQLAVDFWWSRLQSGFAAGSVQDGLVTDTEGNYTVAYPMLVIARQRSDPLLEALALDQYRIRRELLVDQDGAIWQRNNGGRREFRNWNRGIAWYFLGLVRGLSEVRERTDLDDLHAEALRVMSLVLSQQQPGGLWRNFIDDPQHDIDTSGSAGIAAALALGAAHGMLPEAARAAARRTLDGLYLYLTSDGLLDHATPGNRAGDAATSRRILFPVGMGLAAQLISALEVPSFASWRQCHFDAVERADLSFSSPLAAPAWDGMANLLKYVLDLSPKLPTAMISALKPRYIPGVGFELQFMRLRRIPDVNVTFEVSSDLVTWRSGPGAVIVSRTEIVNDRLELIRVAFPNVPDSSQRFVRVVTCYTGRLFPGD